MKSNPFHARMWFGAAAFCFLAGGQANAASDKLIKLQAVIANIYDGKPLLVLVTETEDVVVMDPNNYKVLYRPSFCQAGGGFIRGFGGIVKNAVGQNLLEMKQCGSVRPDTGKPYEVCRPVFLGCTRGKCAVLQRDGSSATCDGD